jgi:hypothetical protein
MIKKITKKFFKERVDVEMKTPTEVTSFEDDRESFYLEFPSREKAEIISFWKITGIWCDEYSDILSFWKGETSFKKDNITWVKYGKNKVLN